MANNLGNQEEESKAGILALVFSFLLPIVGIILYFVQKDKVQNRNAYLFAALAGIVVGTILRLAAAG